MTVPLVARFDAVRIVAFGSITSSYAPVGTPLDHLTRIIKFVNTTDADMQVSFDGNTLNDYIPAGGFSLYDVWSDGLCEPVGSQVYVQYVSAPTKGSFAVVAIYARGQ